MSARSASADPHLDIPARWRCAGDVGKPFTSHRALSVLVGLAAVVVGFSTGCGSSGSNSQGSEAGTGDGTTSSSSGGGSSSGSGSGSGSGSRSGSSSSSGGSDDSSGAGCKVLSDAGMNCYAGRFFLSCSGSEAGPCECLSDDAAGCTPGCGSQSGGTCESHCGSNEYAVWCASQFGGFGFQAPDACTVTQGIDVAYYCCPCE